MAELGGVLLASGSSRRFGSNKLLVDIDGEALIQRSAAALKSCDRIIAVVREDDDELTNLLHKLGAECVINREADRGMGYSIACAVQASPELEGWCLLPADMPCVQPATTQSVIDALRSGSMLAAPCYRGQRGHPVAFSRRFYGALACLDGEHGARAIVEHHADEFTAIDCDDAGVLVDIDTVGDLKALQQSTPTAADD